MRDAAVERLVALAERDPKVMVVTGDLGFGVLTRFAERFPKQYLNAGVAEQNMLGVATGLALEGKIVFVYSIANFPTLRCLEQIRNDACYHDANVKIVAVGGGFSYGALGISHHATEDLAVMRSLPGITVVSPGDRWEAAMAIDALAYRAGTAYLRLDKSYAQTDAINAGGFELGKFRRVREGSDIVLLATGGILGEVMLAAEDLDSRHISSRVYSVHTLKPFDHEELQDVVREIDAVVTIEEHTLDGGLGSIVAESCLDNDTVPGKFLRLGLKGEFSSCVGSQAYLRGRYGLDATNIADKVNELAERKSVVRRA